MKKLKGIVVFLSATITTFAQDFTGTVLDKGTSQPVPAAEVYFVDLKTGTTTDEKGVLKLNISIKKIFISELLIPVIKFLIKE